MGPRDPESILLGREFLLAHLWDLSPQERPALIGYLLGYTRVELGRLLNLTAESVRAREYKAWYLLRQSFGTASRYRREIPTPKFIPLGPPSYPPLSHPPISQPRASQDL